MLHNLLTYVLSFLKFIVITNARSSWTCFEMFSNIARR